MSTSFSVFPKFFQHLDAGQLASLIREMGLDTTNLIVRDGYWTSESNLAAELPEFMRTMAREGLDVRFATTGFEADSLIADPSPLAILADNGIREFRMGYFRPGNNPREALERARASMERLAALCEKYGIRAVYQIHHVTLIPSPSAVWHLVKGLSPKFIGVEIDPGNQSFEGFENWDRSAMLLGEYITAVGVKDTVLAQDPSKTAEPAKGWHREFAPIYEGVTNWYDVIGALSKVSFKGTFVFMPFYDENDPAAMAAKLKREVAYLREVVAVVEEERAG